MITTRPARRDDVRRYYPEITASFRAWVCEIDGSVEGIIGVVLSRPVACFFSAFSEALRPLLRGVAIMRLVKAAMRVVSASVVPVWAISQPNEPLSPGLLHKLGFSFLVRQGQDDVWEYG